MSRPPTGTRSGSRTPYTTVPSVTARLSHAARPPAATSRVTRLVLPTPPGPASTTTVPATSTVETCIGTRPWSEARHSTG